MTRFFLPFMLAVSTLLVSVGCNNQPYLTAERLDKGLVLVYTGIEGRSSFNQAICRGLDEGGVDMAIELVDWTIGVPGAYLVSLRTQERNRRFAGELADRIASYQMTHPGRPVVLVGQSGGAAMAVWTAEQMPFDYQIDGMILIAAALSPQYPLRTALDRTRRGAVNFYSERDWLILGLGTSVAGTMDGEHTTSAGNVGFQAPPGRVSSGPTKLFQVAWNKDMLAAGHYGGHFGSGAEVFVKRFVVPLVRSPRWNQQFVAEVIRAGLAGEAPPPPVANPDQPPAGEWK